MICAQFTDLLSLIAVRIITPDWYMVRETKIHALFIRFKPLLPNDLITRSLAINFMVTLYRRYRLFVIRRLYTIRAKKLSSIYKIFFIHRYKLFAGVFFCGKSTVSAGKYKCL